MSKKASETNKLKYFSIERLWFVLLLTPILIIAVLMFQHFQPTKRQGVNKGIAMIVGSVEISAVELATIVAKPLSELIAMEVYSVANNSSITASSNERGELQLATYSRLSEIKRADVNPIRIVSYTITEKPKVKIIRETF
jgi:hypothetical protein